MVVISCAAGEATIRINTRKSLNVTASFTGAVMWTAIFAEKGQKNTHANEMHTCDVKEMVIQNHRPTQVFRQMGASSTYFVH